MSSIKLVIIFGVISAIIAGIIVFPAKIENINGVKNVTTENYKIASKYRNVSWKIVVPLDSNTFILEKYGIVKFIKIINKSAKPIEVQVMKVFDRWECKTIDDKVFRINYTIYECRPINVRLAFINVTTDNWKLSTLGIFFRKNKIYVVGDTFAKGCSPIVNQFCNCSKSNATLIAKIKIDDVIIINKMYSDNKLNVSLNFTIRTHDEVKQKRYINSALPAIRQKAQQHYLAFVTWYELSDEPEQFWPPEKYFGICKSDLTPKLGYNDLKYQFSLFG